MCLFMVRKKTGLFFVIVFINIHKYIVFRTNYFYRMTSETYEVRTNPHCLVCNSRVSVSTRNSYQIFNNQVQTCSERPVYCIMSSVLGTELKEDGVHSAIICKKCFKLFNEVDEIGMRYN